MSGWNTKDYYETRVLAHIFGVKFCIFSTAILKLIYMAHICLSNRCQWNWTLWSKVCLWELGMLKCLISGLQKYHFETGLCDQKCHMKVFRNILFWNWTAWNSVRQKLIYSKLPAADKFVFRLETSVTKWKDWNVFLVKEILQDFLNFMSSGIIR